MENSFLKEFKEREYYNQCTNEIELENIMGSSKIKAYIGFDCTAQSLHVGSLLQIMCLRLLQKFGHQPIVLLGGGTTRIGDPSGKEETRKILSEKEIEKNIKNIQNVFKIFLKTKNPKTKPIFVNNFKWLGKLNYIRFLRDIGKHFMILQAYDFLELSKTKKCILQIGGSDQWGNIINGVDLIKRYSSKSVYGLTTPLITLASGAKMGKTEKGAIWLDKKLLSPFDYWQFWRNTDDRDVIKFLKMFTDLDLKEINKISNNDINSLKIILANEATKMLHGKDAALRAQKTAKNIFEKGSIGDDLQSVEIKIKLIEEGINIIDLVNFTDLFVSKSEIRRAIKNKGLKLNNITIDDEKLIVSKDQLDNKNYFKLSHGKKKHILLKFTN